MTEPEIAGRIRAYWAYRGLDVGMVVTSVKMGRWDTSMTVARSDMVNGLPRGITRAVQCDVAMPMRGRE